MFSSLFETVGMKNGSGGKKKMSTTSYLAERHGIDTRTMYGCRKTICFLAIMLMLCVSGISHIIFPLWLGFLSTDVRLIPINLSSFPV
jgi:hypothetical protein